ncbi:potassium channel family protein [Algoriphagus sp.]|uniref:potassium channel family protein n=1 Tax=Algoriphagus sp. TaxID=1872435 RepID=UPI00391B7641
MKNLIDKITENWLTEVSIISLLISLIFTVFILPILIELGHVNFVFVNAVFVFLFFVGIWSSDTKLLVFFTSILFLVQLSLRIIRFSDLPIDFYLAERIIGLLNMAAFIFLNIRLLFKDHESNTYRIMGAVNVYLLVAIYGAFGFEVIQLIMGDSISDTVELSGVDSDFSTYIYFSMVSVTTVGFGDFVPVNIASKMLSVFLSMVGILYPAIVIARLIGAGGKEK